MILEARISVKIASHTLLVSWHELRFFARLQVSLICFSILRFTIQNTVNSVLSDTQCKYPRGSACGFRKSQISWTYLRSTGSSCVKSVGRVKSTQRANAWHPRVRKSLTTTRGVVGQVKDCPASQTLFHLKVERKRYGGNREWCYWWWRWWWRWCIESTAQTYHHHTGCVFVVKKIWRTNNWFGVADDDGEAYKFSRNARLFS